ncbi:hypothetical protein J6590_014406 [Homalodisca vitripennis]|nr:hypothetical protein J6590_014406 [Homalodisca vitripennis]
MAVGKAGDVDKFEKYKKITSEDVSKNAVKASKALSKFVTQRLSTEASDNPDSALPKSKLFPILEVDLGFDTSDQVMNQAAIVLRVLYIYDLQT